ncbi:hypothetical protein HDK90DRAFT_490640 [Phyllosticta capitalensis]|uniref:Uncharacterized protein n=1 Tax=Phyllosticta capitalensis TaxID=121624 RepID=A0ABR1YIP7_9PEZI
MAPPLAPDGVGSRPTVRRTPPLVDENEQMALCREGDQVHVNNHLRRALLASWTMRKSTLMCWFDPRSPHARVIGLAIGNSTHRREWLTPVSFVLTPRQCCLGGSLPGRAYQGCQRQLFPSYDACGPLLSDTAEVFQELKGSRACVSATVQASETLLQSLLIISKVSGEHKNPKTQMDDGPETQPQALEIFDQMQTSITTKPMKPNNKPHVVLYFQPGYPKLEVLRLAQAPMWIWQFPPLCVLSMWCVFLSRA